MGKDARIEMVQTGGFTMDYLRFGRGDQVLAILPGLSVERISKYANVVASSYSKLAEIFTILVFDRRNELPATYSVDEMAKDTAAAMRALGLDQAFLFGASQGGMMAMLIASEHPKLVGKLVLGSTTAYLEPAQFQAVEKWIELAKDRNAADLYQAFGKAIYPQRIYEQLRNYLLVCAKDVTEEELARFVILAEGMRGFDARTKLQGISCPVLLTCSADDAVLGARAADDIAQQLVSCASLELQRCDGYGHASYDTAPDYKARMLRFLLSE